MKPYKHRKLEESPDCADIKCEGRRSRVGSPPGKSGECRSNFKRGKLKKVRRHLKRADKQQEREAMCREHSGYIVRL